MQKFAMAMLAVAGGMLVQGAARVPAQEAPLVEARLVADVSSVKPGEPFTVGVLLEIREGWHVYWKNPGEAGMATSVEFSVPQGFEVGEVQFPVPSRFVDPGEIVGYGYSDQVMLMATIRPPSDLAAGETVKVGADTAWLACERICVMGEADLDLTMNVGEEAEPANRELFETWRARLPRESDERIEQIAVSSDTDQTSVMVQWREPVEDVEWFPLPPEDLFLRNSGVVNHERTTTAVGLETPRGEGMVELPFLIAYRDDQGQRRGVLQSAKISRVSD